jgi:hypothetical protein
MKNGIALHRSAEDAISRAFPTHPFDDPVQPHRFEPLLAEYLGMSTAFPYLQAGAQREVILHHITTGTDVTADDETTLVVGAFLTWDETGGNHHLLDHGMQGLPGVLATRQHFHSALLRDDIRAIVGHEVKAAFSPATRDYLHSLSQGLSSLDPVTRVAYMVSFEAHAERMITALWERISETFPVRRDDLSYFRGHVGGDDPAEAYHVAMTASMIAKVVPQERFPEFLDRLVDAYGSHIRWCRAIRELPPGDL